MTRAVVAAVIVISVAQPFRAAPAAVGRPKGLRYLRPPASARPAPNVASITYNNDIAPLIADRCAMCHHDGGSAPFALETYADVKRRAALIATVTRNRSMPPWKADPSNGPFIGQHPLSDAEIAVIQEWAAGGAIEGDSSEAAKADLSRRSGEAAKADRGSTSGWQLGTPDLIVTPTAPYTLQADGTDVFRIFVLPLPVSTTRFVRGLEFRPGNPKVVHHANIRVDTTHAARALDEADPRPGYSGLIPHAAHYPEGHFLGWTPGQVAPLSPNDLAWTLERDTDLVVEIHMQPSGKPESVQPSVGIYFGDTAPTRTPAMLRLGRQSLDIPPGDQRYTITDSYSVPVDVRVEALQPHAHYRARDIRGEATLPDGSKRELIHIRDWDFRWQHVYRFVTPFWLPKGTTLSMEYRYDNSATNVRNPERPAKRARWGQRSSDEMGDLWIQVLTRDEPDLVTLTREFRTKVATEDAIGYEMEIERLPSDAGLHDDAALLYLELGRPDRAVEHFQRTLALRGDMPQAHYNLGTAFAVARKYDEAIYEFQRAIRLAPGYAFAHNNLGNVYFAQKKYDEAIREFTEAVRLQPDLASAQKNLAAAKAAAQRQ
jgi:Flp pilus assembly protein TadD